MVAETKAPLTHRSDNIHTPGDIPNEGRMEKQPFFMAFFFITSRRDLPFRNSVGFVYHQRLLDYYWRTDFNP
jgi:hypothetical protein